MAKHRMCLLFLVLWLVLSLFSVEPVRAFQLFSVEDEIQIGRDLAARLEAETSVYRDRYWEDKLETMGARIAAVSRRPELPYVFQILNDNQVNALAVPGGFVYINKGLLDVIETDDELAAVVAHEVAHIANRHGMAQLERNIGISLGMSIVLRLVFGSDDRLSTWQRIGDIGFQLMMKGYSRENEFDADQTGVVLMAEAGYDPMGMVTFLERLLALERREPSRLEVLFRTHPPTSERIRTVEERIASL